MESKLESVELSWMGSAAEWLEDLLDAGWTSMSTGPRVDVSTTPRSFVPSRLVAVAVDIVRKCIDGVEIYSTTLCESIPRFLDETDDLKYLQCY